MHTTHRNATLEILNDLFSASTNLNDFNNNISNNLLRLLQTQGFTQEFSTLIPFLQEFYASKGLDATIKLKKNIIEIKTIITNPNNNAYIDFLSLWIKSQFNNKEITPEIFQAIINHSKQHFSFHDEKLLKSIIRNAIKKSFNLKNRDSLFFKNFKIYVRKFDYDFAQINKELRNIKKLNSSQLLAISDKDNISMLLKNSNPKMILQDCTNNILQNIKTFPVVINAKFYNKLLHNVTRDFRIQIGKILDNQISSFNQTCFAEDFVRENIIIILLPLAKKIIYYFFSRPDLWTNFLQTYQKKLLADSNENLQNILADYFATQEKIDIKNNNIQNITRQIKENEKNIFELQQKSLKKDTELQNLNKDYENNKANLKATTITSTEQENINSNLSRLLNEQKTTLFALEKLTESIEMLKKDNNMLQQEIKSYQTKIQELQANMFSKTEKFNIICNNFANYLIEYKNEIQ
ncbi:coiled-coil domain-containing protein [Helicobacter anatolicus]|uniref:coiled-coil domain-containing protein n=1 Tax=Helicobacter anatolicus TaxID=2905874 RepID=UPI001E426D28|nr:hypothetical protein [Helicobacter anatolicus]MCE3040399.1 hypothetical protein [Helicobacter anatolicus]